MTSYNSPIRSLQQDHRHERPLSRPRSFTPRGRPCGLSAFCLGCRPMPSRPNSCSCRTSRARCATARRLASVEEQTAAALDALGEQLAARGLGYGDVVAVNVFLRDTRHFQAMNGVYRGYFQVDPPTRATVEGRSARPGRARADLGGGHAGRYGGHLAGGAAVAGAGRIRGASARAMCFSSRARRAAIRRPTSPWEGTCRPRRGASSGTSA